MRNLFIWEEPIDWSHILPVANKLPGEHFFIRRVRTTNDPEGIISLKPNIYKPDNILVFRYDTFQYIKDIKATKYQLYHGLADKGIKCIGGQIWRLGMYYDFFIEAGTYYGKRMVEVGKIPKNHVIALGYPKLDMLPYYKKHRKKTLEEINLPINQKTVFYAPTGREENSLYEYLNAKPKADILEFCLENIVPSNVNLILKTHDEIPRFKKLVANLNKPNIKFVEDYNSLKYVAIADIILSDCSSVMFEGLAADLPVIQYINNEKNFYKETCDWWDYTIKVYNLFELQQAIKYILTNLDIKRERRIYYRNLMFVNLFNAGSVIADFIVKQHEKMLGV